MSKIVKVSEESHKILRIMAAKQGVTMKELLEQLIKGATDGK